jgi:phage N-6-adenine-methyltransferase
MDAAGEGGEMINLKVHYSSLTPEWSTPEWLFKELDKEFHFTLDAACTHENAKTSKHYTKTEDGLRQSWKDETVWLNPPYGRVIGDWIAKAYQESQNGANVVCLIPSRTDTRYWHDYVMKAKEIRFIKGRLRFNDSENSAPFPSAIVIFQSDK